MAKNNKIKLTIEGDARSLFEAMTELQALPVQSFMRQYDAVHTLQQRMETQLREQIRIDQLPSLPSPPQYALPPATTGYSQPLFPPTPQPQTEPVWEANRPITVPGVTAPSQPSELATVPKTKQPSTPMGRAVKGAVELVMVAAVTGLVVYGAMRWVWPQVQGLLASGANAEQVEESGANQ